MKTGILRRFYESKKADLVKKLKSYSGLEVTISPTEIKKSGLSLGRALPTVSSNALNTAKV